MIRTCFNKNWFFNGKTINLPHDAMIDMKRSKDYPSGSHGAYFNTGIANYEKKFTVDKKYDIFILEFEGVYQFAKIYLNNKLIYESKIINIGFKIDISSIVDKENENTLIVEVSNQNMPNSRWYTGLGLIKPVYLYMSNAAHFINDEIKISTPIIKNEVAKIEINAKIKYDYLQNTKLRIKAIIYDNNNKIITDTHFPVTAFADEKTLTARTVIYLDNPILWSLNNPYLYRVKLELYNDIPITNMNLYFDVLNGKQIENELLDTVYDSFGIRKIEATTKTGLLLNDQKIILKGACIHEDEGILGNIELEEFEFYRVKKLKEAGFNAIRIAHQKSKEALLKACDNLGMLILEETFDYWLDRKTPYDLSNDFYSYYLDTIDYIVKKDYNHPSVIIYSIGNEINILNEDEGIRISRNITDRIRSLDDSRLITNAINTGFYVGNDRIAMLKERNLITQEQMDAITKKKGSSLNEFIDAVKRCIATNNINDIMSLLTGKMNDIVNHKVISAKLEEAMNHLDIVGYNYSMPNYKTDKINYPHRIIFGSETNPPKIDELFKYCEDTTSIIGDFTWTGWDYLGEVGIGITHYDNSRSFNYPYPCLTAYCGDLDITGFRRPLSYFREIVYKDRIKPYICFENPKYYGLETYNTPWSVNNSIRSYCFEGYENKDIRCVVYSSDDFLELYLNDKLIGKSKVEKYQATFDFKYQKGTIKVLSYKDDKFIAKDEISTALNGNYLNLNIDKINDYYFILINREDENKNPYTYDTILRISDLKDLENVAFGSANPINEDTNFKKNECNTFEGRAFLILKKNGDNPILSISINNKKVLYNLKEIYDE